MGKPLAIAADFSDLRTVKTRKVLQLILEIPAERAKEALDMLGFPQSDKPIPVAIALLKTGPVQEAPVSAHPAGTPATEGQAVAAPTAKERYAAMTPGQKAVADAAMLAKDTSFQLWASDLALGMGRQYVSTKDFIHDRCAVASCAEFATDPRALQRWHSFRYNFDKWAGNVAEVRG